LDVPRTKNRLCFFEHCRSQMIANTRQHPHDTRPSTTANLGPRRQRRVWSGRWFAALHESVTGP
jgi:hypothetical protein